MGMFLSTTHSCVNTSPALINWQNGHPSEWKFAIPLRKQPACKQTNHYLLVAGCPMHVPGSSPVRQQPTFIILILYCSKEINKDISYHKKLTNVKCHLYYCILKSRTITERNYSVKVLRFFFIQFISNLVHH